MKISKYSKSKDSESESEKYFNVLYTHESILYSCAMGMFFYKEICEKNQINNIVSVGHSPYQISYFIEEYYKKNNENLNVIYMPFSGKEPDAYIFKNNKGNIQSRIRNFLNKNSNIIDGLIKNTPIMNIVNKSFKEKIAILDYVHGGGGVAAFLTTIIICIIYKYCGSEKLKECQELIRKSLSNIYLYCMTMSMAENYMHQLDFSFIRSSFGIDINFNDHVYINDNIRIGFDNFKDRFNLQRSINLGRCVPPYKYTEWEKYDEIMKEYKKSINPIYCEKIKNKIKYAINNENGKIIKYFKKIFSKDKFYSLPEKIKMDKYDSDDSDEYIFDENKSNEYNFYENKLDEYNFNENKTDKYEGKKEKYLVIDFDCTLTYINVTKAYNEPANFSNNNWNNLLKKNKTNITNFNKLLKNKKMWDSNRELLMNVIFGGKDRFEAITDFLLNAKKYVDFIYISSNGFCDPIYDIVHFFGLNKYIDQISTKQKQTSFFTIRCDINNKSTFMNNILKDKNAFIYYIDDSDGDYNLFLDDYPEKASRLKYFGYKYGLEFEQNGLTVETMLKIADDVMEVQKEEKKRRHLVIDFDCTLTYINITKAYNEPAKFSNNNWSNLLKKNKTNIINFNKLLKNKKMWDSNRELLMNVIFGGKDRFEAITDFLLNAKKYVDFIYISSNGFCDPIYDIVHFFGLNKYIDQISTKQKQTLLDTMRCNNQDKLTFMNDILKDKNAFIYYIDDSDGDYNLFLKNYPEKASRLKYFGHKYGLELEQNGLTVQTMLKIADDVVKNQKGGNYKEKYLKYKGKYLQLKSHLMK